MAVNINTVVLTGNLTRDPELRNTTGGTDVCSMRLAVNGRRKDSSGEWIDDANFFDVTVFGKTALNCEKYLSKGNPIAVQGRLDWREWETDEGNKRQATQVIANQVQFLSSGDGSGGKSDQAGGSQPAPQDDGMDKKYGGDDDIPF